MSEDVRCRINYVEPTNISYYSDGAMAIVPSNDLVMNPLEEYCMAVDLEVVVPLRKSCSLAKEDGNFIRMNYSSTAGTISFMNGTDGHLTTNFTDINVVDPTTNTKECLGIESIDIDYTQWMAPQVTIKFVDVRGGSVMLPEEKEYQDGGGTGSIYRSLFCLPSPMFKLTVKGFYGKGVTYYLAEESIDIELDSSSGNFNITAKFIGMMYRIYADIPFVYICAAPYMAGGDEYWQNKVSSGVFMFENQSGTKTPMCKFPELNQKIVDALNNPDRVNAATRGEQVQQCADNKINAIDTLIATYPLRDWFEDESGYYLVSTSNLNKKDISDKIKAFLTSVETFDKSYNTNYEDRFASLDEFAKNKGKKIGEYNLQLSGGAITGKENTLDLINGKTEVIKYINKVTSEKVKVATLFVIKDESVKRGKEIIEKEFSELKEQSRKEKEDAKAEYEKLQAQAIENSLGFTPSIKNIFNLAFAHMDTFMAMYYAQMDSISQKLTDNDPERMKEGHDFKDTDISIREVQLPPYPAFYNDVTRDGETRRQLVWPEEIKGGSDFDEVIFVKNILAATKMFTEEMLKAQSATTSTNTSGDGNRKTGGTGDVGGAPSTRITHLVPLTINDFTRKDSTPNPYQWIKNADETGGVESSQAFEEAVLGAFAIRALHYLSTNSDKKREFRTFGKLEGINFISAFGDDYYSERFYDFIKRYADDNSQKKEANEIVNIVTNPSSSVWKSENGTLLKNTGNGLSFGLGIKGLSGKIPVGTTSAPTIKTAINGTGSGEGLYINEDKNKYQKEETFFYFDSRDYINEINKNLDSLVTISGYGLSNSEIKSYKDNFDSIYNKDDVRYANGAIVGGDGKNIKDKELQDMMNGSQAVKSAYWVSHPAIVNGDLNTSLFEQDYYKAQDNMLSRAYLFLSAVPLEKSRKGTTSTCTAVKCENGVELKLQLLREGSYYWRANKMNGCGTDPINTLTYKKAGANEAYITKAGSTTNIVTKGDYITITPPSGKTKSRERVLAKLFEDWANSDYKNIENVLSDTKNYDPKTKELIRKASDTGIESVESIRINDFMMSNFFKVGTIFDFYVGRDEDETTFSISSDSLITAFNGFMETLEKAYKDKARSDRQTVSYDASVKKVEDPFNNDDLRLSTYMTLKAMYDKWLAAPFKGRKTWEFGNEDSDFNTFAYIDTFYHDIGNTLKVNVTKVWEWLSNFVPSQNVQSTEGSMFYTGKSLYEYLTEIAQDTGGMLISFPQRIGGVSTQHMGEMFKAIPFVGDWETDESTFVYIYTYKPSEHLGNGEYEDDGMDLQTEQVRTLLSDKGYQIPAFGVTYGKQNQAYFKNITLNTTNPAVTDASIKATIAIASKGSEGARETSLFGQDLYRIKTSYSYQCEFDMMGCMQVMPLMYFQLNNVPFWRGGYIIYNVKHSITAGDITTHVIGQKLNKYAIPLTEGDITTDNSPIEGGSSEGDYSGASGGGNNATANHAGSDYNNPGGANQSVKYEQDFEKSNVTNKKPLIAIWPAHSKSSNKGSEWYWSSKLIDEYIIPKLRRLKYSDGTSYNVHRVNKGKSYISAEIKDIINTYGSDRVISIVPHWNGARGARFEVYSGKQYQDGSVKERNDSINLSNILREEVQKVVNRSGEFRVLPTGMMKQGVGGAHILGTNNTDPAVQLDCCCVLTENFYADYGDTGANECKCIAGVYSNIENRKNEYAKKDQAGRYLYGEGWLLSDEGFTAISNYHVEAIRRYIQTYHDK